MASKQEAEDHGVKAAQDGQCPEKEEDWKEAERVGKETEWELASLVIIVHGIWVLGLAAGSSPRFRVLPGPEAEPPDLAADLGLALTAAKTRFNLASVAESPSFNRTFQFCNTAGDGAGIRVQLGYLVLNDVNAAGNVGTRCSGRASW